MINLKLISTPDEEKILIATRIYKSTHTTLMNICEAEQVRPVNLIRSLINEFIADYIGEQKSISALEPTCTDKASDDFDDGFESESEQLTSDEKKEIASETPELDISSIL